METLGDSAGLTLYSYRRCPFAIRVRMVLEEKQIPYTRIEEDLANLSPDLLAMHPEGRVPLLVHEIHGKKNVFYQSTVITEYLDEAFPQAPLMPRDPVLRAQVRLWTYWCDQIFKPELDLFKYEQSALPADERAKLVSRLHQYLAHWNLGVKNGFLVGDVFSLADIHLFPFARQFFGIKPPLEKLATYSDVAQWLTAMTDRAAFERCMTK